MPTPHINAEKGDFAKIVLMPGDPARAKFIAHTYLTNVKEVTSVRGILGFTGDYNGTLISVMASGMGMPSIGIYSWELYTEYDVETIVRVGSCGSFASNVELYDVVIPIAASTNSNYMAQYNIPGTFTPTANFDLVEKLVVEAKKNRSPFHVGNILSSDIFYDYNPDVWKKWAEFEVLAVEMESAALFMNAIKLKKKAACILTVSDSLVTGESTSSKEREKAFTNMMVIALEALTKQTL